MKRAFATLVRLYPRDYRVAFGAEMLSVFEQAIEQRRAQGRIAFLQFAIKELIGLAVAIGAEWISKWSHSDAYVRAGSLANTNDQTGDMAESAIPRELVEAQKRIDLIIGRMVHSIANHQFEKARCYSAQEFEAREDLRVLREKYGLDG